MKVYACGFVLAFILVSCKGGKDQETTHTDTLMEQPVIINLPAPDESKSKVKFAEVVGWPAGKTPIAPAGYTVSKFADGLNNPRWIYVAPNGDILVAEANTEAKGFEKVKNKVTGKSKSQNLGESSNRVTLFRDTNNDGRPEMQSVFLSGLNQPFGMLILNGYFYVANTDGLFRYPYKTGDLKISGTGKKILDLPAGGYNNHWTRNLLASKEGDKIYISVGSGSNVAEHGIEHETRRANILQINPDGSGEKVFASGLRNPVGMDWAPGTNTLWTAVNERDNLGDDLVPDYITSVKEGAFYGWPYSYFGAHEDPRLKGQRPDLVKTAVVPDVALGSHTASLGLAFDKENIMSGKYAGGAFIGQHGSWNSSHLVGYQVAFVGFKAGKAISGAEPFLTGFIASPDSGQVYGRPVGVAFTKNAMLVADDVSNTIWRVSAIIKK